jgi:hypothetical protein
MHILAVAASWFFYIFRFRISHKDTGFARHPCQREKAALRGVE